MLRTMNRIWFATEIDGNGYRYYAMKQNEAERHAAEMRDQMYHREMKKWLTGDRESAPERSDFFDQVTVDYVFYNPKRSGLIDLLTREGNRSVRA